MSEPHWSPGFGRWDQPKEAGGFTHVQPPSFCLLYIGKLSHGRGGIPWGCQRTLCEVGRTLWGGSKVFPCELLGNGIPVGAPCMFNL